MVNTYHTTNRIMRVACGGCEPNAAHTSCGIGTYNRNARTDTTLSSQSIGIASTSRRLAYGMAVVWMEVNEDAFMLAYVPR